MSARVAGVRLVVAFVRHRGAQIAMLMLLGFALGGAVIGLTAARDTAQQAVLESPRADIGHRTYVLQTGNPEITDILRRTSGVAPVQDEPGDVIAGDLSTAVLVRATTDTSLRLGVVSEGTRPSRPGEVLLSERTARLLGIAVGDTVRVRVDGVDQSVRVVGFSVDPADTRTSTVVWLVQESPSFHPTIWLGDANFYRQPDLKAVVDSHRANTTYSSVRTLLEAAAENQPRFLSTMQFVPTGTGLLFGVMIVAFGVVLAGRWRTDVDTLVAAGMSPARAWRRILAIACGAVLAGEVVGGGAAVAALAFWRVEVSSWVGQRWVGIAVPWLEPLVLLGLTVLAAVLTVPVVRAIRGWASRLTPQPAARQRTTVVATVVAGTGLLAWAVLLAVSLRFEADDTALTLAPFAAVLVAAAAPFVITPILCQGLPPATRALMRHLAAGLRPVAAVAAVVVLSSSIWTAQTTYEANSGEAASSPLEPAGSFVISAMPDAAIPTLTEVYRSHGGTDILQFRIPDEPTTRLRVTGPKVVACMSEHGTTNPAQLPVACLPERANAPINMVYLGLPGSTPLADANLLENGKVGLLMFSGSEPKATRLADTPAAADPRLGGNLPGLVVPEGSDVAKEFGLTPGGTSMVTLLDFSRLAPDKQFLIRTTAMRLAPGAQLANGNDPTAYDRLRTVANTVGLLGAAAAAVVMLLGGISMVIAHTLTRRTLVDLGTGTGPRWSIAARWTAVPVITMIVTAPLAILTVSSAGQSTDFSFGVLWLAPALIGTVASLVIGTVFLRAPRQSSD